jgi:hypothetical protein
MQKSLEGSSFFRWCNRATTVAERSSASGYNALLAQGEEINHVKWDQPLSGRDQPCKMGSATQRNFYFSTF